MLSIVLARLLLTTCLLPPVASPVTRGYQPPVCDYCPGHRTIEFRPDTGVEVVAPAAGVVRFAGPVVDLTYVVVDLDAPWPQGSVVSVGGLVPRPDLAVGSRLSAGQVMGVADGRPVTLSLRREVAGREAVSLDPTPRLARPRPRLVPAGGSSSGRSPAPRRPGRIPLVCPTVAHRLAGPDHPTNRVGPDTAVALGRVDRRP